jgi:phosphoribosylamine--glycine ligase
MNVLVVGSGGREHALAWKLANSDRVNEVLVAPGNAGTAREPGVRNIPVAATEVARLVDVARAEAVGLVVVGPEAPLVAGLVDALDAVGIPAVGAPAAGARLEGSKAFAKEIMNAAGVPTARYARVTTADEVHAFCDRFDGDALVVKADGLAAGKGVIVCDDVASARTAAIDMLEQQTFGNASTVVVLEERLHGPETSYIVLTDGERYAALPTSQDHKRLLDGDKGPNTGGMGAYSPAPFVDADLSRRIERTVIEPTLAELRRRGVPFRGFLYAGMMLTRRGPMVLEFNARLGDPETQALMTALDGDLVPALEACARGDMSGVTLPSCRASAVVVLAAEGYPSAPKRGAVITGLDEHEADGDTRVFHAGTTLDPEGNVRVAGGRVLGVTAWADTPEEAVRRAYDAVEPIDWPGMHHRRDIGAAVTGV